MTSTTTTTDPGYGIAPPGYRLPSATRLGAVRLQVADLDRSLAWYREVLGLEAVDRNDTRAALAPPGTGRVLIELHERRGATPVPRRGRLGLYHYALLLPDRPALGRFLRHLAEINERAGMSDHLVSEALYLSDPDGLGIEIYADRPRAAWRHQNRQLVMATDPLDVESVLAAGGGEPWSGMPAGTVLGHVHLYVDDLDRAARFYHAGLGLDRVVWSYPGALFLSAGGYHHHLGTNTWAAGAALAGENDARLLEWEIVLPDETDVVAAARSLEQAGASVRSEAGAATAADPWGTRLRLKTA
ncbi:MAG: VOC family protein [Gemmatimonadales bacterium]|jgi:catechol 2,3-dioxygenase